MKTFVYGWSDENPVLPMWELWEHAIFCPAFCEQRQVNFSTIVGDMFIYHKL